MLGRKSGAFSNANLFAILQKQECLQDRQMGIEMQNVNEKSTKREIKYLAPTPRFAMIQGSFWMSFCIIFGYVSVYLLSKGFSNSEIGIVIAVAGAISAFLQPLVADFADKTTKISLRYIISFFSLLIILVAIVLLIPGLHVLWIAIFYGTAVAGLQILTPLTNAIGMECVNRGIPVNFGLARGIGSISYAAVSYVAGRVVTTFSTDAIPVMIILLYVILIIATLSFRFPQSLPVDKTEKNKTQKDGKVKGQKSFFATNRKFFLLLVGVTFSFISHNLINNYMFQIMQYHGGGSSEMGTALAIAATLELPTMLGFVYIIRKFNSGILLKVSGAFFFVKAILMFLAPNIVGIYISQGAQILAFALQVPASVYYVNSLMQPEDRVKGQAFMTATNTLGSIGGSLIGGVVLDYCGVKIFLLVSVLVAGIGMLIIFAASEKVNQEYR